MLVTGGLVDVVGIEPTGPEGTVLQTAEAHHLLNTSGDMCILTHFHARGQDFIAPGMDHIHGIP